MRTIKSNDVRMLKSKDILALFKEKMNYTASDAQYILDNVVNMLVEDVFMNGMGVDVYGLFKIYPHNVPVRKVNSFDNSTVYSNPRTRLYFDCSKSFEKRLTEKYNKENDK